MFQGTPPNLTKTYTFTRKEVFYLSLLASRRVFVILAILFAGVYFGTTFLQYGADMFNYPLWLFKQSLIMVCIYLAFITFVCYKLWSTVKKFKWIGIPITYGINSEAMHSSCAYFDSVVAWAHYLSWSEGAQCFYLFDGSKNALLPKALFSEEELAMIREQLGRHVGKLATTKA